MVDRGGIIIKIRLKPLQHCSSAKGTGKGEEVEVNRKYGIGEAICLIVPTNAA
jgi:hypothetical protein